MRASTLRQLARHRTAMAGFCPTCGRRTLFLLVDDNVREGLLCARCRAAPRHRHVSSVLADFLNAESLVYVADNAGPIARAFSSRAGVTLSAFQPGVELGVALDNGATCQDLEQLTYADAAFDIVVTEDVLEHVRHPETAFGEIHRVLRPGGVHVFTVPYWVDRPTLTRVDTSGADDVLLMEPEWHGDAIRGRILAYRTFGVDMLADLDRHGLETEIRLPRLADKHYGIFESLVFVSRRVR